MDRDGADTPMETPNELVIISDVHANLQALVAVLDDIAARGLTVSADLGDNVGYGGDPEAVVALMREKKIPSVRGNHEQGVLDIMSRYRFNPQARQSVADTEAMLDEAAKEYLTGLPVAMHVNGARLVHGCPPDLVDTYLFEYADKELPALFRSYPERLCFVGHTHDLAIVGQGEEGIEHLPLGREPVRLDPDKRYIVNAGSVGQPRDGDNRAKYVIWRPLGDGGDEIRAVFVSYDYKGAAARIIERGLPERYARRLEPR